MAADNIQSAIFDTAFTPSAAAILFRRGIRQCAKAMPPRPLTGEGRAEFTTIPSFHG